MSSRRLLVLVLVMVLGLTLVWRGTIGERVSLQTPATFRHHARMLVTAYCLSGHTATGTAVGWGTIAVDPRIIRLGSRMYVSGYGYGRALDTGGAVRGYHVDVWMSSCYRALRSTHYGTVRW